MNAPPDHLYRVFELTVALPYAFPALPAAPPGSTPDARVTLGRVPPALPKALAGLDVPQAQAHVAAGPAGEVLWVRPTARYLITAGETIMVDLLAGQRPGAARHFVHNYCLPALLIQRGLLVLHANALAGPRGAVVLMGASGAGKSTLHAALMRRGLPMLSDDVTVLRLGADGRVWVLPGARQYRLTADTVAQMDPVAEMLRPLPGDPRQKVLARAPEAAFQPHPVPLQAIYLIEPGDDPALSLEPVRGAGKFGLLANGSFPPLSLTHQPAHLKAVLRVLPLAEVVRVRRPRGRWTVEELADAIG